MTPREFVEKLRAMPGKMAQVDLSEPLEKVAVGVWASVGRNFTRQVDDNGINWPPRKDNLPHPLLKLTLAMSTAATGGPGSIKQVMGRVLKLGIDAAKISYWKKHQEGSGKVPQRKYFYLHEDEAPVVKAEFKREARVVLDREVFRD